MASPFIAALFALALCTLAAACGGGGDERRGQAEEEPVRGPRVAAAGDIACPPGERTLLSVCRQGAVARLIERLRPDVVAPLGDLQYNRGTLREFRGSYAPTWGRLRHRTRPAVGNHEYYTPGASGYFAYWGARAGPRGRGWYSYDLGSWHVVVLNSNCDKVPGGCGPRSPQVRWLRADLRAHPRRCTLAYWHHARFSSGKHGDDPAVGTLWGTLQAAGADVVLSGHDHDYERFAAMTAEGRADARAGMVQFVVGTGGANSRPIRRVRPHSRARLSPGFGVLELTLGDGRFAWRFVGVPGTRFRDAGTARCR